MPNTDIFGWPTPASADPNDPPTDMATLAGAQETSLMAMFGQERTVARASGVLTSAATASKTYLPTTDAALWTTAEVTGDSGGVRLQPESIWRPTAGFLLPLAGLKSTLTLKCWATAGETDPELASGEVIAAVNVLTGDASRSAGLLGYAVSADLGSAGGTQSLTVNAPVVAGNGAVDVASATLDVAAATTFDNAIGATKAAILVLQTSAGYAQTLSSPVHYFLDLTHKYADID